MKSEYDKKFAKLSYRFLTDEIFESVSSNMLENYWLENYGVSDIEELCANVSKLKLRENQVLTKFDGSSFIVQWV